MACPRCHPLSTDTYLARAEAMGDFAAKTKMKVRDRHYIWLLGAIEYAPVYGKGEDNYGQELEFQGLLFSRFNTALLDAREKLHARS